ncbi:MAG: hypothetical protein INR66_13260 [Gordonia polyisoprenivorans]|nr:hypothetical protein [Gordonia polyisoprenivorans]
MSKDDADGIPEAVREYVTETPVMTHSLFPAMAAAENLTTVVRLIDDWDANGKTRTVSDVTLLRAAIESSARTVWLLSPTDRSVRRGRALIMTKSEVLAQKKYLEKVLASQRDSGDPAYIGQVEADLQKARTVLDELDSVPGSPTIEQIIELSSAWVDETAVNPQHAPMRDSSRSLYAIASGIAHGYTWTTRHMRGVEDIFNITADFLYAAVSLLSAAVILHEAQAAGTSSIGNRCPAHIRPVAKQLRERYVD